MTNSPRSVFVSELVRHDQELSAYRILTDELALQALCLQLGVRTPNTRRPFAVISANDIRVKRTDPNGHGGYSTSYHRIPLFTQGSAADQQPVTKVRHDRLLQSPMVVQLPSLEPRDPELQDKLTDAVAARLWEPVRARRAAALVISGFAVTGGATVAADCAVYSHGIDSGWIFCASIGAFAAGAFGTLSLAEACKPDQPQILAEINPPLRIEKSGAAKVR